MMASATCTMTSELCLGPLGGDDDELQGEHFFCQEPTADISFGTFLNTTAQKAREAGFEEEETPVFMATAASESVAAATTTPPDSAATTTTTASESAATTTSASSSLMPSSTPSLTSKMPSVKQEALADQTNGPTAKETDHSSTAEADEDTVMRAGSSKEKSSTKQTADPPITLAMLDSVFKCFAEKLGEDLKQPFAAQQATNVADQRTANTILAEFLLVAERAFRQCHNIVKSNAETATMDIPPLPSDYVLKWLWFWMLLSPNEDLSTKALNVIHIILRINVIGWSMLECCYQQFDENKVMTKAKPLPSVVDWEPIDLNFGGPLQNAQLVAMSDTLLFIQLGTCMRKDSANSKSTKTIESSRYPWLPCFGELKYIARLMGGLEDVFAPPKEQTNRPMLNHRRLQSFCGKLCHAMVNVLVTNPMHPKARQTKDLQAIWILFARMSLDNVIGSSSVLSSLTTSSRPFGGDHSCHTVKSALTSMLSLLAHLMERRSQLPRFVEDGRWCDLSVVSATRLKRTTNPTFEDVVKVIPVSWEDGIVQALCDMYLRGQIEKEAQDDEHGEVLQIPSEHRRLLIPTLSPNNHFMLAPGPGISLSKIKEQFGIAETEPMDEIFQVLDPNVTANVYATASPEDSKYTIEKYGTHLAQVRKSYAVDNLVDIWDNEQKCFVTAKITHFYSKGSKVPKKDDATGSTAHITTDEPLHEVRYLDTDSKTWVDFARSVVRPTVVPRSTFGPRELPKSFLRYVEDCSNNDPPSETVDSLRKVMGLPNADVSQLLEELGKFTALECDAVLSRMKSKKIPHTTEGSFEYRCEHRSEELVDFKPTSRFLLELLDSLPMGPMSVSASHKLRERLATSALVYLLDTGENSIRRMTRKKYIELEAGILDRLQNVLYNRGESIRSGENTRQHTMHEFIEKENSIYESVKQNCVNTCLPEETTDELSEYALELQLAYTLRYVEVFQDIDALEAVFSLKLSHKEEYPPIGSRVSRVPKNLSTSLPTLRMLLNIVPIGPLLPVSPAITPPPIINKKFYAFLTVVLRVIDHCMSNLCRYEKDEQHIRKMLSTICESLDNPNGASQSAKDSLKEADLSAIWTSIGNLDTELSPETWLQLHGIIKSLEDGKLLSGKVVAGGRGFRPTYPPEDEMIAIRDLFQRWKSTLASLKYAGVPEVREQVEALVLKWLPALSNGYDEEKSSFAREDEEDEEGEDENDGEEDSPEQ